MPCTSGTRASIIKFVSTSNWSVTPVVLAFTDEHGDTVYTAYIFVHIKLTDTFRLPYQNLQNGKISAIS